MPNTDLNTKNARLIVDHFRARRAVGMLGIGGSSLRTPTAERYAGTLSAFRTGSQGVSPRSRSQRSILSVTEFASNPDMRASAARTAVRRLACAAFLYRGADPHEASNPRLVVRTVARGAPISKYAAGALAAMPSKATRRGRRCSQ